jgi:hypothetical protein
MTSAKRTDEALWERIKKKVMAMDTVGTSSGQWSARKAQMAVRLYKEAGGAYKGTKPSSNSLAKWTKQDWTTKSGKPSSKTGERYLPRKAIQALSDKEYKKTTTAKRKATAKGKQFSKQPKDIADKTKDYR